MSRLNWTTTRHISIGQHKLPCSDDLQIIFDRNTGLHQVAGIRPNSRLTQIAKSLMWPAACLFSDLLVDGFTKRTLGGWVRKLADSDTAFLEIGCGPMRLRSYLPRGHWYNGLDLAFSEFQLGRVLGNDDKINLVLASATNIPLESNTVSLIALREVFQQIVEIDQALREIHRVARPGAKLVCSIANVECHKFKTKGRNPDFVQSWSFEGFKALMASHGFKCLEGTMKGWWVPLPTWLTKTSYQMPITSREEYYNTCFMYIFEVNK